MLVSSLADADTVGFGLGGSDHLAHRHMNMERRAKHMEENTTSRSTLETLLDTFADLVADKLAERMKPPEPEPLPDNTNFTVKQAAKYIGVNESSIRRWGNQGQFPMIRHGNRIAIYKKDLDEWQEAGGTQR